MQLPQKYLRVFEEVGYQWTDEGEWFHVWHPWDVDNGAVFFYDDRWQSSCESIQEIMDTADLGIKVTLLALPEDELPGGLQRSCFSYNHSGWILESPTGDTHEVKYGDLRRFSEMNNLKYTSMSQVANGRRKHHKNWRLASV